MQSSKQKDLRISDVICEWAGWHPQNSQRKTRTFSALEPGLPVPAAGPAAPAMAPTAPVEYRPEYQTNLLLIFILLGGLFYASSLNLIIPFGFLSAVLVYFDAENIHAGYKFGEVLLLGEVASWRPIVWAAAVFIGSFLFLTIYLVCRREIYNANN